MAGLEACIEDMAKPPRRASKGGIYSFAQVRKVSLPISGAEYEEKLR